MQTDGDGVLRFRKICEGGTRGEGAGLANAHGCGRGGRIRLSDRRRITRCIGLHRCIEGGGIGGQRVAFRDEDGRRDDGDGERGRRDGGDDGRAVSPLRYGGEGRGLLDEARVDVRKRVEQGVVHIVMPSFWRN